MASFDLATILGLVVVSFCIATAALIAAAHFAARNKDRAELEFDPHGVEPAVMLFDGSHLIDATDRARRYLNRADHEDTPWAQLIALLSPSFAGIEPKLSRLPRGETLDLWSSDGAATPVRLMAEWRNSLLRITIVETDEAEAVIAIDAQNLFAMEKDVALLNAITESAPYLIWKSGGDDGQITWANQAYLGLGQAVCDAGSALSWPPPRIFARLHAVEVPDESQQRRVSLSVPGSADPLWFDTEAYPLGRETLHFAVPADSAVQAEGALREFIQTLAKTFAHLPIGLAIFNRDRRLALFNPALTDLSSLPVDFLSARPSLSDFLDELRNRRVMPEPKDYKSWRQQITALEAEAMRGTYTETWTLPSGQTYRVSGRPHPEGAVAFLFEDISSQVTLTRRFRTDMEMGQAVMDAMPEALAVFSTTGILTTSNAAYTALWGIDPSTTIGEISISDASRRWIELCEPTPVWGDVRDFVATVGDRAEWFADVRTSAGRTVACRFVPLSGGGTLVAFSVVEIGNSPTKGDTFAHSPAEIA